MRMFSINEKGQESIINFGLENNWMMDQESFSMLIPSRYHIEAVEDTELLIVSNSQLQLLMDEIPAIDRMMRLTDRQKLISTQQRVHAAISMTAEERYHNLLTAHPEYTQRFSQNMIAAYLGIKSETLSRIRKR
jgi:CRP-like cAMP-binding protein